jgi:branched-chain amino acid transport system ATP-binding protein
MKRERECNASSANSVAIVMIEHDMDAALAFAETVTVLHSGQIAVDGPRAEVVAHPKTREIYLGTA